MTMLQLMWKPMRKERKKRKRNKRKMAQRMAMANCMERMVETTSTLIYSSKKHNRTERRNQTSTTVEEACT
jgi:hypothetical protein